MHPANQCLVSRFKSKTGDYSGEMGFVHKLGKLNFLPAKSNRSKENASKNTSKEAHLKSTSRLLPPIPFTPSTTPLAIEERWRRAINASQKADTEKENESGGATILPGLLKFCATCGLMEVDEVREMEQKGYYSYEHHPLSRTERRQKRIELENYILQEVVETERMIKSYLKGEIG